MTDKLREEIRQLFSNALYCTSSEESIDEVMKIIERERKAAYREGHGVGCREGRWPGSAGCHGEREAK